MSGHGAHGGGAGLGPTFAVAAGSAAAGAGISWAVSLALPASAAANGGAVVPLWLVTPFALLLLCVAILPLLAQRFWLNHYQDLALGLGAAVVAYYLCAFTMPMPGAPVGGLSYGAYKVEHTAIEYLGFIALIGSLYVVSGCILIDVRGRGGPVLNTAMLAFGSLLANLVGTTGASMLLIRPFLRVNQGRLRPIHVVFFIFTISNCGGSVTPIGDPPLYLGYLVGVPFMWTIEHLWTHGLAVVGALLVLFFAVDSWVAAKDRKRVVEADSVQNGEKIEPFSVSIHGAIGLIALPLIVAAIFVGPSLDHAMGWHAPLSTPLLQIAVAALAFVLSSGSIRAANHFTWHPINEVALLFAGIFATMMPALAYLAEHGGELGITTPRAFYFATGALSAVLDNAPTYLNFLQVAMAGQEMTPPNVRAWLGALDHPGDLIGISTGAVFFGAMTYIGNGPNFMVKSIAEQFGVKMPAFFGYLFIACVTLLPILIAHAWMVR